MLLLSRHVVAGADPATPTLTLSAAFWPATAATTAQASNNVQRDTESYYGALISWWRMIT